MAVLLGREEGGGGFSLADVVLTRSRRVLDLDQTNVHFPAAISLNPIYVGGGGDGPSSPCIPGSYAPSGTHVG